MQYDQELALNFWEMMSSSGIKDIWKLGVEYKKIFFIIILAFLFIALFVIQFGTQKEQSEKDYVTLSNAFTKWTHILDTNDESFAQVKKLLTKHPELKAEYDPLIAQNLLIAGAAEEAKPILDEILLRNAHPFYSDYSRTSFTIASKNYQQALNEAVSLKQNMLQDQDFLEAQKEKQSYGSNLFAFNLLRIATLHQVLNNRNEESLAWKEFKQCAGWEKEDVSIHKIDKEGFHTLLSHFTIQDISLLDYIGAREKKLATLLP